MTPSKCFAFSVANLRFQDFASCVALCHCEERSNPETDADDMESSVGMKGFDGRGSAVFLFLVKFSVWVSTVFYKFAILKIAVSVPTDVFGLVVCFLSQQVDVEAFF